jgi:hypothetical protein
MEINLKKNAKWVALVVGALYLALFTLSSFYYKVPVLHPVGIWHGAQLSVVSLMSDGESSWAELEYDKEEFERITESAETDLSAYKKISLGDLSNSRIMDIEVKNQIAANQARQNQLKRDTDRLKEANEQLLNSKKTLEGLNQDFSTVAAYQQSESTRQQMIQDALSDERDLPSEADAKALLTQSGKSNNRAGTGIPEKVLTNVQQTTGISPEEINELMNQ